MKIIIGYNISFSGGLAASNERLASEYIQQGHEVEIFTFSLQYPFLFGKTQFSSEEAPTDLKIHRRSTQWILFRGWADRKEDKNWTPDKVIFVIGWLLSHLVLERLPALYVHPKQRLLLIP